jgi:hypothetical protein
MYTIALTIVMMCILLTTGCTTKPVLDNQTVTFTSPTVPPPTQPSEALYKVTIAQPDYTHADYIKMDSDVYNQGEVIEFYVINEGTETLTCANSPPSYRIYHQIEDNSWEIQRGFGETMSPLISYFKPGEKTRVRRLITTDWLPGRYRIVFDCGISREFELRRI